MELKKIAYRQTKDGSAVTFLIHPDDISSQIATSPIGACFEATFKELNYDNPDGIS